jgi:hypothetical protein
MTTEANTSPETGITTDQAATQFESLLSGPADTEERGETQETDEHDLDENDGNGNPHDDENEPEDSETDEHEEPEGDESEQPVTVEIDGKPVTLAELEKGYLRQSDYTKKTTELAAQRQAVTTELSQVQQERAQYAQALEQANALLAQLKPQEPDWNALYQADPAQYAAAREMWRSYHEQQSAVEQQRQAVAARGQADQTKAARDFVEQQRGKLTEALPAWNDPKVASAERAQILDWGKANGFSEAELSTIADHRAVVTMRKAMLFDRAQAARQTLKPGQQAPTSKVKPATPGAAATRPNSVSESTRAKQRLAKTGKVQDAAAAIAMFLD